jgi:hypothetical protein
VSQSIAGPEFRRLVLAIGEKPGGLPVAMEILSMRLMMDRNDKRESMPEIAEAGRALLTKYEFNETNARSTQEDHQLGTLIPVSLAGEEGVAIARGLCRRLMEAASKRQVHAINHDDLMRGLFKVHPTDILDELFSGDKKECRKSVELINDLRRFNKNPLDTVSDDELVVWCDRNPSTRYPLAASVVTLYSRGNDTEPHAWSSLAHRLLKSAPDPDAVLGIVVRRLRPSHWSGSLATKLESRLKLLEQFDVGETAGLIVSLEAAKVDLQRWIAAERKSELELDRARSGRFE